MAMSLSNLPADAAVFLNEKGEPIAYCDDGGSTLGIIKGK